MIRTATATVLALTSGLAYAEINGFCQDGKVHFAFPYENQETANLLYLTVGTCDETSAGSDVTVSHENSLFNLEIDVTNCGLNDANSEVYQTDATVVLGENDNGIDLIFQNISLSATCGTQTDYQVEFSYSQIEGSDDSKCQNGVLVNGVCHFNSAVEYAFEIKEFTDSSYATASDASNRKSIAGQRIYLGIDAINVTSDMKWAVKSCSAESDNFSYPMFDASNNCENAHVGLNTDFQSGQFRLDHILFMMEKEYSEFKLVCDIKLCDKSDISSECNSLASNCFAEETAKTYLCESLTCTGTDTCNYDGTTASCGISLTGWYGGHGNCDQVCSHFGKTCDMSEQYGMTREWCGDNYDKVEMIPGQEGSCNANDWDCSIAYQGWADYRQGSAPCQIEGTPGRVWYYMNKDHSSNVGNNAFLRCDEVFINGAYTVCYCV